MNDNDESPAACRPLCPGHCHVCVKTGLHPEHVGDARIRLTVEVLDASNNALGRAGDDSDRLGVSDTVRSGDAAPGAARYRIGQQEDEA